MKLSVSLPADDVEYLDTYARTRRLDSRSAALRQAVRLLRASELGGAYEEAWTEWSESGDEHAWDVVADDGLG